MNNKLNEEAAVSAVVEAIKASARRQFEVEAIARLGHLATVKEVALEVHESGRDLFDSVDSSTFVALVIDSLNDLIHEDEEAADGFTLNRGEINQWGAVYGEVSEDWIEDLKARKG